MKLILIIAFILAVILIACQREEKKMVEELTPLDTNVFICANDTIVSIWYRVNPLSVSESDSP